MDEIPNSKRMKINEEETINELKKQIEYYKQREEKYAEVIKKYDEEQTKWSYIFGYCYDCKKYIDDKTKQCYDDYCPIRWAKCKHCGATEVCKMYSEDVLKTI